MKRIKPLVTRLKNQLGRLLWRPEVIVYILNALAFVLELDIKLKITITVLLTTAGVTLNSP